jgi:hypothetical protein
MKVVILGCGPAGLAAAWAAVGQGADVTIISKSWEPSTLYGCQYLHAPIPGFEDVSRTRVQYNLVGTPEQYRYKVYGEHWQGRVSPEDFIGEHDAWDIRETYRRMWSIIVDYARIERVIWNFRNGDLSAVHSFGPDKIISAIPAWSLCYQKHRHSFRRHMIYANGSTKQDGLPLDHVICDGTDMCDWYRISNVFGYRTVEWPAQSDKHPHDAVRVYKPLSTDCDCHPDVIRVGRYGAWEKGFLVHQVYDKVVEALRLAKQ